MNMSTSSAQRIPFSTPLACKTRARRHGSQKGLNKKASSAQREKLPQCAGSIYNVSGVSGARHMTGNGSMKTSTSH